MRRPTRTEARNARAAAGFLLPFLALFLLCFIAPIVYAVWQSLHKTERTGPLGLGGAEREVFTGLLPAFLDQGFREVARRSPIRPIVRRGC